ncbi:Uncharacterised protein [Vibrio cholerae]|nr:Uncharacterised protein [Vibrio cholerae]
MNSQIRINQLHLFTQVSCIGSSQAHSTAQ